MSTEKTGQDFCNTVIFITVCNFVCRCFYFIGCIGHCNAITTVGNHFNIILVVAKDKDIL